MTLVRLYFGCILVVDNEDKAWAHHNFIKLVNFISVSGIQILDGVYSTNDKM